MSSNNKRVVRLLWGGSKNLMEETLMGENLVIVLLMGYVPPQPAHNRKLCGPKIF